MNSQNDSRKANVAPDVANRGFLRPPLVHLVSIVLGLVLHEVSPARLIPHFQGGPIGSSLILLGIALLVFAVHTLRAAGTPVPGNQPATTIVRGGPYRFSRNPIYLAFTIAQFGIAVWMNSMWLLAFLILAFTIMSFVVIPREERYLEAVFAAEYIPYKSSTRRWL